MTTKQGLEEMRAQVAQVAQAARQTVLDLTTTWIEAAAQAAGELRALVTVAGERVAAEQQAFAADLRMQRQAGECERFGQQMGAYAEVLQTLAARRQQLQEARLIADPVRRVLLDIELRGVAARQAAVMVAAGASPEEAQAATALPPREALPAPKVEGPRSDEPNGTAQPNSKGRKRAAAKE
jgi:hypothetical protein